MSPNAYARIVSIVSTGACTASRSPDTRRIGGWPTVRMRSEAFLSSVRRMRSLSSDGICMASFRLFEYRDVRITDAEGFLQRRDAVACFDENVFEQALET